MTGWGESRRQRPSGDYYTAAVCRRGHVESSIVELKDSVAKRCDQCGALVITACVTCSAPIRGAAAGGFAGYEPPEFCTECGTPFPWASQQSIAYHIENTLEEQADLAEGDRRALEQQLVSLREPATSAEVERRQIGALVALKELAPKAFERALPLVSAIATAEIKRALGLPP